MLALIGITHTRNWIFGFSTIALLILISIPLINPIQKGSGDLTHSEIAIKINELDKSRTDRWATDTLWLDSLLLANTKEHLSGQQMTGPNRESWHVLDPKEEFVESWNRGASYVTFLWTEGSEISINSPGRDIIQISMDPCDAKLSALSLDYILTGSELSDRCLSKVGTYLWQDADVNIYKRN
jgi:hypothetical protein